MPPDNLGKSLTETTIEKTDAELVSSVIESMKAGCGCIPHGLPVCNDRRCPNSPQWGGLIQFGFPAVKDQDDAR